MGYIGTKPTAAPLTSSQLEDGLVTAAKLATDAVETAKVKDLNVTNAKIATGTIDVTAKITGTVPTTNLGSGSASASTYLAGDQTYQTITEYDDSVLQSNVAMLGFKVAVNGSLTRYNLVDQSIDEFFDTSGVDASASTNEERSADAPHYYFGGVAATITEDADDSGVDGDYTWYKWTDTASTGSYATSVTQAHEVLVTAGGGSGGGSRAGGGSGAGGAGGYRTASALSLVDSTSYTITVGAGGAATAAGTSVPGVTGSVSSISGSDITDIESAGGGGGGHASGGNGLAGGSGGGGGGDAGVTGATGGASSPVTIPVQGYAGGTVTSGSGYGAGGGGSSAVGADGGASPTAGGAGTANDITGASVTYAAGGAAGNNQPGAAGTVNTGNGGQGAGQAYGGGAGGSGIVILRRLTSSVGGGANLTLQSTDVTAEAQPTYGEFVTLIENAHGTATLNTDIKGYVSRDSGATFTQGTLVDEGTWGTNKKILGFHDLDISAQPSGTAMCYKIETLNQSVGSKVTRVYATSIGWR